MEQNDPYRRYTDAYFDLFDSVCRFRHNLLDKFAESGDTSYLALDSMLDEILRKSNASKSEEIIAELKEIVK